MADTDPITFCSLLFHDTSDLVKRKLLTFPEILRQWNCVVWREDIQYNALRNKHCSFQTICASYIWSRCNNTVHQLHLVLFLASPSYSSDFTTSAYYFYRSLQNVLMGKTHSNENKIKEILENFSRQKVRNVPQKLSKSWQSNDTMSIMVNVVMNKM